nr:GAF domain-containing protein [Ardenticatena sp.]
MAKQSERKHLQRFSRSLVHRIWLGYVVVLGIALVALLFSYYRITQQQNHMLVTLTDTTTELEAVIQLNEDFARAEASWELFMTRASSDALTDLSATRAALTQAFQNLETTFANEPERLNTLEAAKTAYQQWESLVETALERETTLSEADKRALLSEAELLARDVRTYLQSLRGSEFEELITLRTTSQSLSRQAALIALITFLLGALVAIASTIYVMRSIARPVEQFIAATQRVRKGEYTPLAIAQAPREFQQIGVAFNQMLDSLRQREQQLNALNTMLRQRVRELNTLLDISRSISSSLDMEEVLRRILRDTVKSFPKARKAMIHLVDEEHKMLVPVALSDEEEPVREKPTMHIGEGIAGRAVIERRSFCITDTAKDPSFIDFGSGVRSLMVAPLIIEDRVIGALSIDSDQPGTFTSDHELMLQLLASRVAVAIQNAELYQQSEKRIRALTRLYQSLLRLAGEHELAELRRSILQETLDLLPARAAVLFIKRGEHLFLAEHINMQRHTMLNEILLQGDFITFVRAIGATTNAGPIEGKRNDGTTFTIECQRYIAAPLAWENEVRAVLLLLDPEDTSSDTLQIISLLAQEAAAAYENALLLAQEKRRIEQLTLLHEIGRRLYTILDLDHLLTEVVFAIQRAYGYAQVNINLVKDDYAHLAATTDTSLLTRRKNRPLKVGAEGIVGYVAATGKPQIVNDVQNSAFYVPTLEQTRSEMALPIFNRSGEVIGVLDLQDARLNAFDESDMLLLQTLTNQLSVAIENAQLFRKVQQHAEQVTRLLDIIQHLRRQPDLPTLFEQICRTVSETLGWDTVALFLRDEERGVVLPAAAVSRDPALEKRILGLPPSPIEDTFWQQEKYRISQSYFIRAEQLDKEQLEYLRETDRLILHDEAIVLDESEGRHRWHPADVLIIPIRLGDRILGHLSVDGPVDGLRPSWEQIQVLELFAHQVATAIEDARLISELQARTEELQRANEELARASRLKSEFLANMSHELRTPLNSIIGFSEVLQDEAFGELNEHQHRYLNNILTSAHHLLDLINDILDLSKIEAGRMDLHYELFDLHGAIEEVVSVVQPLAEKKGLELKYSLDHAPARIVADRLRFKQVLYNIVSNAIKFTEEGSVTIWAWEESNMLRLTVEDTGVGIPADKLDTIFEAFTRVEEDRYRRSTEGTGLGLTLTRRLVEMHGGRIWIESEEGKGTRVHIEMPLQGQEQVDERTQLLNQEGQHDASQE